MKRYPEYKDSGVEWLGEIPKDWGTIKLKYQMKDIIGGGTPSKNKPEYWIGNIPWVSPKDMKCEEIANSEDKISLKAVSESATCLIPINSVLIVVRSGILKHTLPVAINTIEVTLNQDMKALIPKDSLGPKYLFHLIGGLQTELLAFTSKIGATVDSLEIEDLMKFTIPIPQKIEQTAICIFLDRKTSQIDSLISKKKQMTDLLKEERAAIINHAVTKGINPDAEMKDSGVEWLGEVPKHWEIKQVKHLTTKIGSGITPKGGADVYQTSGIPLLRSQNIHFSGLRIDDVAYITKEIHESMSNSEVFENDVLLNITGASIGRCFYADKSILPANVNQHVCILRPNDDIEKKYLCLLLSSQWGQFQIDYCQNGANREGLNFEQLKNFTFPMPPKTERLNVFTYIDQKTSQIDSSITHIEKEISLIEEYRTALINETVTGKIDIREHSHSFKIQRLDKVNG